MQRNLSAQYYPHALLLLIAMVGLSITLSQPDAPELRPDQLSTTQPGAGADTFVDTHYIYPNAKTRSLAEIFENARNRYNRLRQNRADAQDQTEPQAISRNIGDTQTTDQRLVHRQDIAWLTAIPMDDDIHYTEYVSIADPTLWDVPDALPQREYDILAYGEIGGTEPAPSPRAADTSVEITHTSDRNTDTRGLLASDAPGPGPLVAPVVSAGTPQIAPAPAGSTEPGVAESITVASAAITARPVHPSPVTPAVPQSITAAEKTAAVMDPTAPQQTLAYPGRNTAQTVATTDDLQPVASRIDRGPVLEAVSDRTGIGADKPAMFNSKTREALPTVQSSTPVALGKESRPAEGPSALPGKTAPHDAGPSSRGREDHKIQPLVMLIDDHDALGAGKLNAIDNAIKQINSAAQKAGLGIELKTTTDKHTDHNILLREDNGNNMGNKLGLAEFAVTQDKHGNEMFLGESQAGLGGAARISINKAFDWFAGEGSESIGQNQYDYQTAVTHEVLHMIGLDDDFDNLEAVSHGLLSPGEIRREIDAHEVKELASIFQSANPWRSLLTPTPLAQNNGRVIYRSKALTASVPEPASLALVVAGLLSLCRRR